MRSIPPVAPLLLLAWLAAPAQDFQELQKKTTDFTLSNGMRFVVVERHGAPMVAARVYVGAGTADDPPGQSGMSRFFERALLTGPEGIGTRDAAAERKALDAMEDARTRLAAERSKGVRADESRIAALSLDVSRSAAQANALGNAGEYSQALADGGIAWSFHVDADSTSWDSAVPSERMELWFLMQAQALHRPSFRGFYEERDELASTWRARVEGVPFASMMATLPAAAFLAHPYRNPVEGWGSDVAELRLSAAREFFDRYWTPGNITIALAGDITGDEARRWADRYFGPIPARPAAARAQTVEPEQRGPRTVAIENSPEAMIAIGYRRPDEFDRDQLPLEIIAHVLTGAQSAWLQHDLVETKRLAVNVQSQPSLPGGRRPSLFVVVAGVAPGHTTEQVENAIGETIARLQNTKLDDATLERARAAARRALVSRLEDNAGIAGALARFAAEYGDWRRTFEIAAALDHVTAEQVQIAALKYLTPLRRTSVRVNPPLPAAALERGDAR